MNFMRHLLLFMLVASINAISWNCMDREVAEYVYRILSINQHINQSLSAIPDNLFVVMIAVSIASFCVYSHRTVTGKGDSITCFSLLLAIATPLSYLAKTWFKYVFGRVDPHQWLITPELYGFHWLSGGNFQGFPSGHMTVFTTIAAAVWRYYPRHRGKCLAFLGLLAGALVATDSHFLSDVIAGAYLGLLAELTTFGMIRAASCSCVANYLKLRGSSFSPRGLEEME